MTAATAATPSSRLDLFRFSNSSPKYTPSLFLSVTSSSCSSSPIISNVLILSCRSANAQAIVDNGEPEENILRRFRSIQLNRLSSDSPVTRKALFCRSRQAESDIDGSFSLRQAPSTLLAAEKEEAKAVLTLFLKKQGLSDAVAARTINKSDAFVDHLASRLHTGLELTTSAIHDALIPYLQMLLEEYGAVLPDFMENFPNPPVMNEIDDSIHEEPIIKNSVARKVNSKKLKTSARVGDVSATEKLPSHFVYLVELGMEPSTIMQMMHKYPPFANYSLEDKIKPLVELLLRLGVPKSDIPTILRKYPPLCGMSLTQNLIPTIEYLEELGMDKKQLPKVLHSFPGVLRFSKQKLKANVDFLYKMGFSAENVNKVISRSPNILGYSLEGKIKPVVEFLIELGVPESDIASILRKSPQLCRISLTRNLIPTMEYLEELGMDKKQWAKIIYRYPPLLICSRQKLKACVDFLYEMGLSAENVSKAMSRWPNILGCSVEDNLRPTADYFRSLGIDATLILHRAPQTFCLSIEQNLKPTTDFFLERGYSLSDIATMVSRFGNLYSLSLQRNMIPKWEFFLTMGYPKIELVKFPSYFGYSLEDRIKPRSAMMRRFGIKLPFSEMLWSSDSDFDKLLKRKMDKQV